MSDVLHGDCLEIMRGMDASSVDAIVTDPPYELGFMGKGWDASGIAFNVEVWRHALRVLKPGGYLLAFGGTRTYHRMTVAIEDAGFEIRDCIGWHYGTGFPKSLDVSKAIDKAAGAEREVVGFDPIAAKRTPKFGTSTFSDYKGQTGDVTAAATDAARQWSGWGTALKPAWEPVVVARKPLEGTVAANVLKHGTGAINVDACRVEGARWPANILLTHAPDCSDEGCAPGCPCAAMDASSGGDGASRFFNRLAIEADDLVPFFYTPKASRSEREAGCAELPERVPPAVEAQGDFGKSGLNSPRAGAGRTAAAVRNHHPTVKPISVMEWCIRLVTRDGALVLDPFCGSGTTGAAAVRLGRRFIGCEQSAEYVEIARARIAHHGHQLKLG
jgi:DNA modification methylase